MQEKRKRLQAKSRDERIQRNEKNCNSFFFLSFFQYLIVAQYTFVQSTKVLSIGRYFNSAHGKSEFRRIWTRKMMRRQGKGQRAKSWTNIRQKRDFSSVEVNTNRCTQLILRSQQVHIIHVSAGQISREIHKAILCTDTSGGRRSLWKFHVAVLTL